MTAIEGPGITEETPLVVTSQVGTEVVPPKPDRAETSYVVLQLSATVEDENGPGEEAWLIASEGVQARSAEVAVRSYAEGMKADKLTADGVTLVAIPARSWKPVRLKPQTVTTILIEEA